MYDVIVIGMGISGISSAIYLKRAGKNVLMLEGSAPGGIINNIVNIENYPGIKSISGPDFAYNLFLEVNELGIEYKLETVTDVSFDSIKTVKTGSGTYQAKYVVIATGRQPKMLGLENEEKYLGRGISTCALCDGALYKGKHVAVIGGGSSALSEAIYLSNIVDKVYLIHRRDEFRGEEILSKEVRNNSKIELILNDEVVDIISENDEFRGIALKSGKELLVSCVFIYIGFLPNTNFLKSTNINLDNGYIVVNKNYETNISGVYACGDVIKKDIYQIVTAASEGASVGINISNL